jgi:hypothetical protein
LKSGYRQNRDCPRTEAFPGFCGANPRSFKTSGTAPDEAGDSPEFLLTSINKGLH